MENLSRSWELKRPNSDTKAGSRAFLRGIEYFVSYHFMEGRIAIRISDIGCIIE